MNDLLATQYSPWRELFPVCGLVVVAIGVVLFRIARQRHNRLETVVALTMGLSIGLSVAALYDNHELPLVWPEIEEEFQKREHVRAVVFIAGTILVHLMEHWCLTFCAPTIGMFASWASLMWIGPYFFRRPSPICARFRAISP